MQADEDAEQDELPLGLPAPGDERDPVEDAMDAAMATTELGGFRVSFPSTSTLHTIACTHRKQADLSQCLQQMTRS